jgi:hypothetical protein
MTGTSSANNTNATAGKRKRKDHFRLMLAIIIQNTVFPALLLLPSSDTFEESLLVLIAHQ